MSLKSIFWLIINLALPMWFLIAVIVSNLTGWFHVTTGEGEMFVACLVFINAGDLLTQLL